MNAEVSLTAELRPLLLAAGKHCVMAELRLVAGAIARGDAPGRESDRWSDARVEQVRRAIAVGPLTYFVSVIRRTQRRLASITA